MLAPEHPQAVLGSKKKESLCNANKTEVSWGPLCFMLKTWARHNTSETVFSNQNNDWRLVVVGGWRLAVAGGRQRLAAGGWW